MEGRQRRGATVIVTRGGEAEAWGNGRQLTKAWWWRGIPKRLGHAVVLGKEYQALWPGFALKATLDDGWAFATVADWAANRDLTSDNGEPPPKITMLRQAEVQENQNYPEIWPFGEPFDPPKPRSRSSFLKKLGSLFNAVPFAILLVFATAASAQETETPPATLRFLYAPTSADSALSLSLPAPQLTGKPDWCKELPRSEYKALESVHVSDPWFEVYKVAPGVFAIYEPHQSEEVISYLILGSDRALLFDTGMGISDIRKVAVELTKWPIIVLNSHTHDDHVGGNWQFDTVLGMDTDFTRTNAKGSREDAQAEIATGEICGELPKGFESKSYATKPWRISQYIHDGDKLDLGDRTIEIIATPGHTPDAISLLDRANGLLFTGDTYYPAPIWLYRPETHFDAYAASIQRLAALAPQVKIVLGAHNIPVASPSILPKLVDAFAQVRAGKGDCKPVNAKQKLCSAYGISFLLLADPPVVHSP